MSDFTLQDHGSIGILTARSDEALAWEHDHIGEAQHWGDGVVIERNYVLSIVHGIEEAGLTVEVA